MRLSSIKLAGFKSFVDPTHVKLASNLVGVVGPNGCGKSNIIDAVRWVLGESSAKHLRGESMADVIFSGSNTRKPVGQASIELVFDNSDGTVGGEYASYQEISVRRKVTRDGQSAYYLNGSKCRRRDITDIFLGTGLGPRSYAIIEQGMISRVIESKPEELRIFLEEAAGISKFKERRRETENRMRHTRENLSRLDDLREELDKQLERLKRQSRAAERYKELKSDERRMTAELSILKIRSLEQSIETQTRELAEASNRFEAALAEQRRLEKDLVSSREQQTERNEALNTVQASFYSIGSEIARLEQGLQHNRELAQRQEQDLNQIDQSLGEIQTHLGMDTTELADLKTFLDEKEPVLALAQKQEHRLYEHYHQTEAVVNQWQADWQEFNRKLAEPSQLAQVELSRIDQIDRQLKQHDSRRDRLNSERQTLDAGPLEAEVAELKLNDEKLASEEQRVRAAVEDNQRQIVEARQQNSQLGHALEHQRAKAQQASEQLGTLRAVQQAALGRGNADISDWLARLELADAPRLAEKIKVSAGWERAAESVLSDRLEAVCVEGFDALAGASVHLPSGSLTALDTGFQGLAGAASSSASGLSTLADKISADWSLDSLLSGIYVADDLDAALAARKSLQASESVVTRDGIWLGAGWLRVSREEDSHAGVLQREQQIRELDKVVEQTQGELSKSREQLDQGEAQLARYEQSRDQVQARLQQIHREHGDVRARLGARQGRLDQIHARLQRIDGELTEVEKHRASEEAERVAAEHRRTEALTALEAMSANRDQLELTGQQMRADVDKARAEARDARSQSHDLALEVRSRGAARQSLEQNLNRLSSQQQHLNERRESIIADMEESKTPLTDLQKSLESSLEQRASVETELTRARQQVGETDNHIRNLEQKRSKAEDAVQTARSGVEHRKLAYQELDVRRKTQTEQLQRECKEAELDAEMVAHELAEDAQAPAWQQELDQITIRISRLGAINLAAIDEYQEQSERKTYLDAQHADLIEALDTLENAIHKIDKETRTRFKETFDKVNTKLQEFFPRLFGGGHAYLELTGTDLLETGVSIMARPPGKRNSSIHLLSGGEKALTAVALVFAFFELNPAPFCMLDEVDAPLDDANVSRFCNLVKDMSDRIQFVFISHNKVTMEIAHELMGVTMHEPGVSRLVAVDVDEAAIMAAS